MADYDRLASQVRAMKPGEWMTVDRDSVDDNAQIAPWRTGRWTPCDFILEQIVGSGYEWSYEQNILTKSVTFKRRQHPLTADDLRTWVSPDRRHFYRLRGDDIFELWSLPPTKSSMATFINRTRALQAASKKLRFKSDKAIEHMCDTAGLTMADAYRCGAEEAQSEVVNRLALISAFSPSGTTARSKDNAMRHTAGIRRRIRPINT